MVLALFIIFSCSHISKEHFWDHNTRKLFFKCKYGKIDSRDRRCKYLDQRVKTFRQHFNYYPIGILYSDKLADGIIYPLLAWYDRDLRKYHYYVRDKKDYTGESIYIKIPGRYDLMTGDTVVIPTKANYGLFKVKLYRDLSRWSFDYYRVPAMKRHLYYAIPWKKVGYVTTDLENPDDPNRFFVLFERKIEKDKNTYEYSILDDKGTRIPLDEVEYLTNGDTLQIPGKKKYGTYITHRYHMDDLLF